MADTGCFAYSDTMIFTNDKAFMMTGANLRFLCAVLNSSAITWLVSKAGLTTGMGLTQWKKFVVETIPVVQPDVSTLAKIDDAVKNVLNMLEIGHTQAARDLDEMIDRMVVDLYGLTSREAKAMKNRVN